MTTDIVAFLNARYDAEEQMATDCRIENGDGIYETVMSVSDATFHRYFDKTRALAEIQSKRQFLNNLPVATEAERAAAGEWQTPAVGVPDTLLRILAMPYEQHPDYQPEWQHLGN